MALRLTASIGGVDLQTFINWIPREFRPLRWPLEMAGGPKRVYAPVRGHRNGQLEFLRIVRT
jgi:hypothetical protein